MESIRAQHLLRNSADIRLVFKDGKRVTCPLFTILLRSNALDCTRIGVITGKKLGGAVQRNRCKRRFRELLRVNRHRLQAGWDLLVLPKRDSIDVPVPDLRLAWASTLNRAGLFVANN